MRKVKFAGSIFLIGIMILSVFGSAVNIEVKAEPTGKSTASGLTQREPIYIEGNENFTVENGVVGGSGMEIDPYIIEGWDINASNGNGIHIKNTSSHFIIRNCVCHNGKNNLNKGIRFYGAQNGIIENTTLHNNSYGIYLSSSQNNTIKNCFLRNNEYEYHYTYDGGFGVVWGGCGIYLYSSSSNNLTNCYVYNNDLGGIRLNSSSDNKITSCSVYNSNSSGIDLKYSSNNEITNCQVFNNVHGIHMYPFSHSNQIMNCSIYNNHNGIFLHTSSNNNQIINCDIYSNSENGIELWNSLGNEVHYCNIYNNTDKGVCSYGYIINATHNWWGSSDGPSGKGPGSGDKVSDNVLYDPWLTKPWEEGIEIGTQPEKEGKPAEGFNMFYLLGIGVAIAAAIIVVVLLLRRRAAVPKPEALPPKPELVAPRLPTLTLRCPQCKTTFKVEKKEKPFKTKCPNCGTEGVIR